MGGAEENKTDKYDAVEYVSYAEANTWLTPKPCAGIIAHGVGVTTMRLLGASSVHRRWYGPKQPAAMISGKRDVSGETEVENRGAKVSWHTVCTFST